MGESRGDFFIQTFLDDCLGEFLIEVTGADRTGQILNGRSIRSIVFEKANLVKRLKIRLKNVFGLLDQNKLQIAFQGSNGFTAGA